MGSQIKLWIGVILLWGIQPVYAQVPSCMYSGHSVDFNEDQVIGWKAQGRSQFHGWGHVRGVLTQVYSGPNEDSGPHEHFQVEIRDDRGDSTTLEVIYNQVFGRLPSLHEGMSVEACGEYITSNRPTKRYQPSPDGALLHWVHQNPKNPEQRSGFLILDGKMYGMQTTFQSLYSMVYSIFW